ncbi:ABC transporter ATP-binding protein [Kitasatospora sp. GP82]|uniref:ABC transporter ATP-binding protein n=1 Tax=Kitasatospora sp. GP82 TaxID=3035089 RepID=UPI002476D60B|nr:ABC transporter ATP-binding protein [Kitasatospora sp. GP82]MDH6130005.1 ABC-2 type transport system ATP-binding protein [Kitasatospora sp. GP82]
MKSGEPVIQVAGLRKEYAGRVAVESADFEVVRGEVFGLLGPNGAGKTSIVEIMEGHRRRSGGSVTVLGQDPGTAGREWRDRIGIVPQTGLDHEGWRVAELVEVIGRSYSNPMPTAEVLELVDLADRPKAAITTLSGGQRRRLDLALGIVGRPEVLFLDEPSTGLDPEARRACWQLISRLRHDGTSIVLTTHYLDEAERLADRVAVLAKGRIVETSTPAELGGTDAGVEVAWRENGETRTVTTHEVGRVLEELRARLGADVPELEVRRPSLESRYLQLVAEGAGSAEVGASGRSEG